MQTCVYIYICTYIYRNSRASEVRALFSAKKVLLCISLLVCGQGLQTTASMANARARLVADPAIGVSDLQNCLVSFLDELPPNKPFNLYEFVLPPQGTSWKSACSPSWLVRLSPLLGKFLEIANNGVLPGKKHRQAIESFTLRKH